LAIEIVSQNDTLAGLMKKANEVWVFDIDGREAFVWRDLQRGILDENDLFQSELIPGFSIRLGDLFDDINR
jgi:Uma2 family endonuclease